MRNEVDLQALVRIPVSPEGARCAPAPPPAAAAPPAPPAPPALQVLDHAGARAASWMRARAWAATDVPDVVTGRRPQALDEAGWARVTRAFADAAARARDGGAAWALGVDDDGLLHGALSPRTGLDVERGLARVLAVHRACVERVGAPVDVVVCVEELCPGGLDATDGIAVARALVAQGARRVYASAGTLALAPLRRRTKGADDRGSRHAAEAALASALWLVGRVDAAVHAVVPASAAPFRPELVAAARAQGLAGVVVEPA